MKNIISVILLLLLPFFGQSQTYRFWNLYAHFYLDSLEIPYLPLNERTGISELPTMSTEKSKKRHRDFFKNTTICEVPSINGPKIELGGFISNYFFVGEDDIIVLNILIDYNFLVTGFADIPIKTNDFTTLEILEVYDPSSNEYSTILLRKHKNGFWDYVNENIDFLRTQGYVVHYD
jgi:hypothetical protein